MGFKRYYKRKATIKGKPKKYAKSKAKSTGKGLTVKQKKAVKALIHGNIENKFIMTTNSEDLTTNKPYQLTFLPWQVNQNLPVIPIIQSIQHPVYLSVDEDILKGINSSERIGARIRVINLKIAFCLSIPIKQNLIYGYRYRVKAVIYKNKDNNDPSQQFGQGVNGYNIFKGPAATIAGDNLVIPSGTVSDFHSVIDTSRYKVCYTEVFELTPALIKGVDTEQCGANSPVGYHRIIDCTKFIKKHLQYDNNKAGSAITACTNENLYMTFFTCDDTGSRLDQNAEFNVLWNHLFTYEDA